MVIEEYFQNIYIIGIFRTESVFDGTIYLNESEMFP